jgi:CheY-like chemotaxis protein
MAEDLDISGRINLRQSKVLVVDGNPQAIVLMRQILVGFGVRTVFDCPTANDAQRAFHAQVVDLIVVDPLFSDDSGFEFIRWARRQEDAANRTVGIIAALGHHTLGNVKAARDAGANLIVAKPLSPEILLQRIAWVAREKRPFIVAANYAGPDRRFRNQGPPPGMDGRRADDLSLAVPQASMPNMSQQEVDDLFKPRRVSL